MGLTSDLRHHSPSSYIIIVIIMTMIDDDSVDTRGYEAMKYICPGGSKL